MNNVSVHPKTQLAPDEVEFVLTQESIFMRAQELLSVPWPAMAAIWYRESFSVSSPKTPGGPFQFDPPTPSDGELRAMLKRYTKLSDTDIQLLVDKGLSHFSSACIFAACRLRDCARYNLSIDHSDQAIKDAFYGYNGRAYGPDPDNSPYVMNNLDKNKTTMSSLACPAGQVPPRPALVQTAP